MRVRYKSLLIIALAVTMSCPLAIGSAQTVLGDQRQKVDDADLKLFLSIVRDRSDDFGTRRRAAVSLLKKGWGTRDLIFELSEGERDTQHVIALATADPNIKPPLKERYWKGLIELMGVVDDEMRPDFARAIGSYDDEAVQKWVHKTAKGDFQPENDVIKMNKRKGAILACGYYRDKQTCELLISLLKTNNRELLQNVAFSLSRLTGIRRFNGNRYRWEDWWGEVKKLKDDDWNKMLLANFVLQSEQSRMQSDRMQLRLMTLERKLFDELPDAEKPTRVLSLMNDKLASLRQLGATLTLDLLTGSVTIDEEKMKAIKGRISQLLNDDSHLVQEVAVKILREPEFIDDKTAYTVAFRLDDRKESRINILKAYLLLLAEKPKAIAIDRGIELMSHPELNSEAAAYVSALVMPTERKPQTLSPDQIEKLLSTIRGAISDYEQKTASQNGAQLPSAFVALLGRFGTDDDWKKIEGWLDSKDALLSEAATRAWLSSSKKKFVHLAKRSDSPAIFPIIIAAARKDVNEPESFTWLLKNEPTDPQLQEIWSKAMVEIAARMPGRVILKSDILLRNKKPDHMLRSDLLSSGLSSLTAEITKLSSEKSTDEAVQKQTQEKIKSLKVALDNIRIQRADSYIHRGNVTEAAKEYEQVLASKSLSDTQRCTIKTGQIAIELASGEKDKAGSSAKTLLDQSKGKNWHQQARSEILDVYMYSARRLYKAKEVERAKEIAGLLSQILGELPEDIKKEVGTWKGS